MTHYYVILDDKCIRMTNEDDVKNMVKTLIRVQFMILNNDLISSVILNAVITYLLKPICYKFIPIINSKNLIKIYWL